MGTLQPLLKYGLKQGVSFNDQTNYFLESKFLEVKIGKTTVFIHRADFQINATHILKKSSYNWQEIAKIQKQVAKYDIV